MSKLIGLPNNDWIDPTHVIAVTPAKQTTGWVGGNHKPRVIVRYREGADSFNVSLVEFETYDQAVNYARELAEKCNSARNVWKV